MEFQSTQSIVSSFYDENLFPEINYSLISPITFSSVGYDVDFEKTTGSDEVFKENNLVKRQVIKIELEEKTKQNVIDTVKILEQRDDVLSASPNHIYNFFSTPNDTEFSEQWGLSKIGAEDAWNIKTGSSAVTIGVIDTGIDGTHPDLQNRIKTGSVHRDFTISPATSLTTPNDQNGHGTHVAGIIAGQGNNGLGISGVLWDARLVSLRVLDAGGYGTLGSLVNAINYAKNIGIPILNLSLGAYVYDSALYNEIYEYSGLVVCAAGNENIDNDNLPCYPASFDLDNIISVGLLIVMILDQIGISREINMTQNLITVKIL